jgi:hypothetical protein
MILIYQKVVPSVKKVFLDIYVRLNKIQNGIILAEISVDNDVEDSN